MRYNSHMKGLAEQVETTNLAISRTSSPGAGTFGPGTAPTVLQDLGLTSSDPRQLIAAVKAGLPTTAFELLTQSLGVTESRLASIVGISSSTLLRRKKSGRLLPEESEHVLRIAQLLSAAQELFGDAADAADWMRSSNLSLGGASPLAFADTEIGAREVEDLLGRIAYGVYS